MSSKRVLTIVAVAVFALAATAQAAYLDTEDATVACSNSDLLQTSLAYQPTNDGVETHDTYDFVGWGPTGGLPILNDGEAALPAEYVGAKAAGIANDGHSWITYTLDTSVNTAGYDLSSIDVFHGWRDSGRDMCDYDVSFSTVAAPTTFADLYSDAQYNPASDYGRTGVIVEPTDLATGVKAVRIDIYAQYGLKGYSEIDVVGEATPAAGPVIPEPSTLAIWALGLLGLLGCARRKRK